MQLGYVIIPGMKLIHIQKQSELVEKYNTKSLKGINPLNFNNPMVAEYFHLKVNMPILMMKLLG